MEKSDQNTKAARIESAIQMFSKAILSLNLAGVILDYWKDSGMNADEVKQLAELRDDLHTLAAQEMRYISPESSTAEDRILDLAERLSLEYALYEKRSTVSPLYDLLSLWENVAALAALLADEDPQMINDPDTLVWAFISHDKAFRAMIRRYAFLLDPAAAASFHDAVLDACQRLKAHSGFTIDTRSVDRYSTEQHGYDFEYVPDDEATA
jgi:hypothetical protein